MTTKYEINDTVLIPFKIKEIVISSERVNNENGYDLVPLGVVYQVVSTIKGNREFFIGENYIHGVVEEGDKICVS